MPRLVMLAEDNLVVALTLEDGLRDAGFAVAGPFMTCASALAWLRDNKPCTAILDTALSDGSCAEVAHELGARSIPFVVHSGHKAHEATPEFRGAPWIEKPAANRAVLDAVRGVLARAPGA